MKQDKSIKIAVVLMLVIAGIAILAFPHAALQHSEPRTAAVKKKKTVKKVQKKESVKPYPDPANLAKAGDWHDHSQPKRPDLAKVPNLWIRVSINGNRTYIMSGKRPVYTMLSSAGRCNKHGKSLTPTGSYHIEDERGQSFFNQELQEGAHYYVSWRDHGIYLFHSVPTKPDGTFNKKEAAKLGKKPGSSGCLRLSVPDAQWLMKNVPTGTRVVIKND